MAANFERAHEAHLEGGHVKGESFRAEVGRHATMAI